MPAFILRAATASEEVDYLRYLASKRAFYQTHGYAVSLPEHPAFAALRSSQSGIAPRLRWLEMESTFKREIYRESDYTAGVARLESERPFLTEALPYLLELRKHWPFEVHSQYTVTLTLYGVGGSYEAKEGRILIRTTPSGSFRRPYSFQTVLHEVIHIGIEEPIVRALDLTHPEKERVVDLLCSLALRGGAPYELSERGDRRVDPYVTAESAHSLPMSLARYVVNYPRIARAA